MLKMSETVGCHSHHPPTTGKIQPKKGTSELSFHKKNPNGINIVKWSQARWPDKHGLHPQADPLSSIKNTEIEDCPTFFRVGFFFFFFSSSFFFCPILKGSAGGGADGDADWSASQATCFNIHDITSAPGWSGLHGGWCAQPAPLIGCLSLSPSAVIGRGRAGSCAFTVYLVPWMQLKLKKKNVFHKLYQIQTKAEMPLSY